MRLQIGSLCLFVPFKYEYNPERDADPTVGIYLGKKVENMIISRYVILDPGGTRNLWTNRWSLEVIVS